MGEAESAATINFSLFKKKHKYGLDGAAYAVSWKTIVAEGKKLSGRDAFEPVIPAVAFIPYQTDRWDKHPTF